MKLAQNDPKIYMKKFFLKIIYCIVCKEEGGR